MPREISIDEQSAKTSIALPVGEQLRVRLRALPTAGYEWSLAAPPDDVLRAAGDPHFETVDPKRIGARVEQVFRFTTHHAGSASLTFLYRRAFEPDLPPKGRVRIDVRVLDATE